jgi:hypothetical protein
MHVGSSQRLSFFIFMMRHGWRPSHKGFSMSGDDPTLKFSINGENVKETVKSVQN